MPQLLEANWPVLLVALLLGIGLAWWLLVGSRRTRIEREGQGEDAGVAPVRRNQALIDAPPAASPAPAPAAPPPPIASSPAPQAPAAAADELERIKGVGPRLAAQLRALGVTSIAQIAQWDAAEIARIDAQLGRFQGRIERDDWVGQARLLAAGDEAGFAQRYGNP